MLYSVYNTYKHFALALFILVIFISVVPSAHAKNIYDDCEPKGSVTYDDGEGNIIYCSLYDCGVRMPWNEYDGIDSGCCTGYVGDTDYYYSIGCYGLL